LFDLVTFGRQPIHDAVFADHVTRSDYLQDVLLTFQKLLEPAEPSRNTVLFVPVTCQRQCFVVWLVETIAAAGDWAAAPNAFNPTNTATARKWKSVMSRG
jgi:hypothetical protein